MQVIRRQTVNFDRVRVMLTVELQALALETADCQASAGGKLNPS